MEETVTVLNLTQHPQGTNDRYYDKSGKLRHKPRPFMAPAATVDPKTGLPVAGETKAHPEAVERWRATKYVRGMMNRGLIQVGSVQLIPPSDEISDMTADAIMQGGSSVDDAVADADRDEGGTAQAQPVKRRGKKR